MSITPAEAWQTYEKSDQLYGESEISIAFDRMAKSIHADLVDANPLLVCVMNGAIIAFAEIIKRLNFPIETDYIHATRYGGQLTGGHISWLVEPHVNPEGRHVLVVDDILDEGETLASIMDYYRDRGVSSARSAVLVVKDRPRKIDYMADYVGLHVPDRYVFGCGMDYKGYLRNLPGIYAEAEG